MEVARTGSVLRMLGWKEVVDVTRCRGRADRTLAMDGGAGVGFGENALGGGSSEHM